MPPELHRRVFEHHRFVSYKDRKELAAGMRAMYTAPTLEAAELALADFDKKFGAQYPGAVDVWRHAWDEFIPFLDYPPELRKVVYTTNAIESINSSSGRSPRIVATSLTRMPR
jgi:putative transposase